MLSTTHTPHLYLVFTSDNFNNSCIMNNEGGWNAIPRCEYQMQMWGMCQNGWMR